MRHFTLISALLKGTWLVDTNWAQQHIALVGKILTGENVDFGQDPKADDYVTPVLMSAGAYKVRYGSNLQMIPHGSIAIVNLHGPITRYGGACTYGIQHTAELLKQINNADNISGVLLDVDTPGGEANGLSMFSDTVKNMKKPVVSLIDDAMCASAGVWCVINSKEIYATNKTSEFGSIGVYTMLADWLSYYESEGLKVHEIYSRLSTEKNIAYRKAMKGDYDLVQDDLDAMVKTFTGVVKAGRKGKLTAKAEEAFKGGMYSATEAQSMGLIDGILSYDAALSRVLELSQKSTRNHKSNTMSKEKQYSNIAKAANWADGHASTEEGIHLSHDEAASVDAALATVENAEATATELATTKESLAAANAKVTTLEAAANEAAEKIAALEGKPANGGSNAAQPAADAGGEKPAKRVDAVTQQAMEVHKRFGNNKK